jgi:hypothetical protein
VLLSTGLLWAGLLVGGCGGSSDLTDGLSAASGDGTSAEAPPRPLGGRIVSLNVSNGALQSFELEPPPLPGQPPKGNLSVLVTTATRYVAGSRTLSSADLKVGMAVEVIPLGPPTEGAVTAAEVRVLPPRVSGVVRRLRLVDGVLRTIVVQPFAPPDQDPPSPVSVRVTARTVYRAGDRRVTPDKLKIGLPVDVILQAPIVDDQGVAVEVRLLPAHLGGTIAALNGEGGTLQAIVLTPFLNPNGAQPPDVTVAVTATTKYSVAGQPATAADLKVGLAIDAALVAPPRDGRATALEIRILPPPQ